MFQSLSFTLLASLVSLPQRNRHRRPSSLSLVVRNFILSLSLFLLFRSRSSVQKTYHFLLCTTDRSNSFIHSFIVFGTIGLLRTRIISRDQEQKNTLTKSQCLYAVLFLLAFRFRQLVGANYFIHGSIGYSTHESAITNRVFVCAYMFAIT